MMVRFMKSEADKYHSLINKAAKSLEDIDALEAPMLFSVWEPNVTYDVGERVRYNDVLYKVLTAHTSQSDWTPDVAVSLFAEVLIPDPEVIPDWVQPESTNPYMTGDKVRHNDKVWVSVMDYNVFEPGVYGWNEVI